MILVWNGHLLGLQLLRAAAREFSVVEVAWLVVPHCVPEVTALAWAGSIGFRGILPVINFYRNRPVRVQRLIPSRTEVAGVIGLLILGALLEAAEIVLFIPA